MPADSARIEQLWNSPLDVRIELCKSAKGDDQARLIHHLLWSLTETKLREIDSAKWDPQFLCEEWERNIDGGHEEYEFLGIIQSLLRVQDLTPRLRDYLEAKGLEIIPEVLKIEAHVPPTARTGEWFANSILACDDYLQYVMNVTENPFEALRKGTFDINLTKYIPLLADEHFTRGKIGKVEITPKINVAFAHHPMAGSAQGSRGILMHDKLYAIGANPYHLAWTRGVDSNMTYIMSLYRNYLFEGVSPKPHG